MWELTFAKRLENPFVRDKHGGVRPVHQKATCRTQSTLGPYVVQIWPRNVRKSERTKPLNSIECSDKEEVLRVSTLQFAAPLSLALSLTHTRSCSLSHTLCLSHTYRLSLSFSLFLSLSLSLTPSLSLFHSLSHTLSLSHPRLPQGPAGNALRQRQNGGSLVALGRNVVITVYQPIPQSKKPKGLRAAGLGSSGV